MNAAMKNKIVHKYMEKVKKDEWLMDKINKFAESAAQIFIDKGYKWVNYTPNKYDIIEKILQHIEHAVKTNCSWVTSGRIFVGVAGHRRNLALGLDVHS